MQLPAFNKLQRATLLVAAAVVAVVQLMYFDENGVEGYGWVLSVIVIAAFCILGLGSAPKPPNFRVAWAGDEKPLTPADTGALVERNLAAIFRLADNLSARVNKKFPEVDTNKGPLSAVTASMIRSGLLMYGLGLLAVCKLRHDGGFLQSDEYRRTKASLANAAARADNIILQDAAPERLLGPEAYLDDLRQVEDGVRAFFRALSARQTEAPAAQLNAWLDKRCGIPTILKPSMDAIAKDEMRLMYTSLFGREPA